MQLQLRSRRQDEREQTPQGAVPAARAVLAGPEGGPRAPLLPSTRPLPRLTLMESPEPRPPRPAQDSPSAEEAPAWATALLPALARLRIGRTEPHKTLGCRDPHGLPGGSHGGCGTHYLCIRETMVLKAAWTSAAEHVHTTGSVCRCRTSERNWEAGEGEPPSHPPPASPVSAPRSGSSNRQGWPDTPATPSCGWTPSPWTLHPAEAALPLPPPLCGEAAPPPPPSPLQGGWAAPSHLPSAGRMRRPSPPALASPRC